MELEDTGFDFTVLSKFRARLVEHGMERVLFERLVEHCRIRGWWRRAGNSAPMRPM
ncbi:hypothetical protein OG985_45895 [Streptomyces sp. NBC_00289]|uniref:hypothetical protein n=1 Tax=Streptomyces sp. NBC_00289 TaxID=2975703 RepID=UPI00324842CC